MTSVVTTPPGHCPLHEGVEMEPATSPLFVLHEGVDRTRRSGVYARWLLACEQAKSAPWRLTVCPTCSPTRRVGHLFVEPGPGRMEWR